MLTEKQRDEFRNKETALRLDIIGEIHKSWKSTSGLLDDEKLKELFDEYAQHIIDWELNDGELKRID